MLEPRSHAEWQAETREALPPGRVRLHALLINDYGAHMDIRRDLSLLNACRRTGMALMAGGMALAASASRSCPARLRIR